MRFYFTVLLECPLSTHRRMNRLRLVAYFYFQVQHNEKIIFNSSSRLHCWFFLHCELIVCLYSPALCNRSRYLTHKMNYVLQSTWFHHKLAFLLPIHSISTMYHNYGSPDLRPVTAIEILQFHVDVHLVSPLPSSIAGGQSTEYGAPLLPLKPPIQSFISFKKLQKNIKPC